jgi:hypothetical protein
MGGEPGVTGAASSLDEPLDAIVYAVHPAMASAAAAEYPYGPHRRLPPAQHEPLLVLVAPNWAVKAVEAYLATIQRPPDFVVPTTFGMSAILGLMTALAMLFACLRRLDAEPEFYFFFSVEAIAICLAQMLYGQAPRLASIIAGAVMLPAFTILAGMFRPDTHPVVVLFLAILFVPLGALLGYLTGTCAAGIFLVMEYLEPYLQGQGFSRARPTT